MEGFHFTSSAWGLTGGIGSGKSLAATILRKLGMPVIDMDQVSTVLMKPGTDVNARIRVEFGDQVMLPDGRIDRRALAGIVFKDQARRRDLEKIVHGPTIEQTMRRIHGDALRNAPFVFVESAIIFDIGLERMLAGTVVVTAPVDLRISRVIARDHVSEAEVRARMAAQMDEAERIARANLVWSNDGNAEALRARIIYSLSRRMTMVRSGEP